MANFIYRLKLIREFWWWLGREGYGGPGYRYGIRHSWEMAKVMVEVVR